MECSRKNSGVTRASMPSLASAFTPFSQNSKIWRWSSGLGHAQLWQSKPSLRLIFSHVFKPRPAPISVSVRRALSMTASIPAATCCRSRRSALLVSTGGWAPGVGKRWSWSAFSAASEVGAPSPISVGFWAAVSNCCSCLGSVSRSGFGARRLCFGCLRFIKSKSPWGSHRVAFFHAPPPVF